MSNIVIDFGNDGFKINAELKMDGNMWCVGIGENIQDGLYVFNKYPLDAIWAFKDEFRNYIPKKAEDLFSGTDVPKQTLAERVRGADVTTEKYDSYAG